MIELKSITLKNFLSHKDTYIDFTTYSGLSMIEGRTEDGHYSSNGSGKSTIFEGVYYALTGKTIRGLTADAVVNSVAKHDTVVSLKFHTNESSYEVVRTIKHSKLPALALYRDQQDISCRTPTQTQSRIDELVGIAPDILSGVMILGEGMSSRFTSLSDPSKKSLLESTMILSHSIDELRDTAKSRLDTILLDKRSTQGSISSDESLLQYYEGMEVSDEGTIGALLESVTSRIELLEGSYDSSMEESKNLNKKLSVLKEARSNILGLKSQLSRVSSSMQAIDAKIADLESQESPVCPTCGQRLQTLEKVVSTLSAERHDIHQQLVDLNSQLERFPPEETVVNKLEEIQSQSDKVERSLKEIKQTISDKMSEKINYEYKIKAFHERGEVVSRLTSELRVLNEKMTSLSKDEEVLTYLVKTVFSSTGVISDILRDVVDYIDQRLQVYNDLLQDKVFHITFYKGKIVLESETLSYQSLSSGEKKRLDISIQFALHDYVYTHCGIGFDTIFIDEILDSLDSVGVSNIIEVLNLKKSYCSLSRIFVITHNESLKDYFDSVLSIRKDSDGYTYII